jgi:glycosyltransferase involved in cell wall biosynthesis
VSVYRLPEIVLALTCGRVGGVDVFSINLVRQLRARGLRARLIRTQPWEKVADPLVLPDDVPVDDIGPADHIPSWRSQARRIQGYLETRAPCIYIPNYDYRHSIMCTTVSHRVTTVGILHSDDPAHYDHARCLGRYWDGIVGVSRHVSAKVEELHPELRGRVETIPYGIHMPSPRAARPANTTPAPERLRVVYIGRIEELQKRSMDLIAVVRMARRFGVDLELSIYGGASDQPFLGRFVEASRDLVESGVLKMHGVVPNADVNEKLMSADVFLLTSAFEGAPVALMEAMACGCVPVVTDLASGIPEMIDDGVEGFRRPVGDIGGLAHCLLALSRDGALKQRMSAAAAARAARDFDVERMTDRYTEYFVRLQGALDRGAPRRRRRWMSPAANLRRSFARRQRLVTRALVRVLTSR